MISRPVVTLAELTLGNQYKNLASRVGKTKNRQPFILAGIKLWKGTITPLGCTHILTRRRICLQLSQAKN
tara:strand:+ start:85 stop:294 length:210 start_codon:yes stop_codon:yes gene_type:complete